MMTLPILPVGHEPLPRLMIRVGIFLILGIGAITNHGDGSGLGVCGRVNEGSRLEKDRGIQGRA
jgi:hypothetical protein